MRTTETTPEFEVAFEGDVERGRFVAPTAETRPAAEGSRLVVCTYNIRYAVGSFLISGSLLRRVGVSRPGRRASLVARHVARAARALSDGRRMPPADLIALQEADRETVRAGGRHVARELARELRMDYAHASMHHPRDVPPVQRQWWLNFEEQLRADDTGETGVALLSRLPLEAVERIELPWSECRWRPRLALAARVTAAGKRLHVFNSHIDPHAEAGNQIAQHEAVLARAEEVAAGGGPVLLLGDFNTLKRDSLAATRRLLESCGYTTPIPTGTPTWRAGLYRLHADWIFTRGARVLRWGVTRGLGTSDHWPVWAEVAISD
ncbi:MAG TPA: endonuclease/exonuclease/phosphatase family protein [Pyrinomonadaceae bacterium]|nr:endonuclease/exonuclease/phosphatase family protein [Pyrinomonadaceae bacterium]